MANNAKSHANTLRVKRELAGQLSIFTMKLIELLEEHSGELGKGISLNAVDDLETKYCIADRV
ncbi:hypothetical protein [Catenovulum agarivorans]|uniref:hypothetical protein n=1 Tax=Catenovulum agarivorans TaxID=1172192 RepID=UPI0012FAA912|nr:hypothetical protein [Catenovulum agarivorans]